MNEIIAVILMGFIIGAAAYVYAVVLQMPGEILSFLPRVASVMPAWAYKPLITCQKCVAGQLSLWLFPIMFDGYNLIIHVFQVTTSIFFAVVITKVVGDPRAPLPKKQRWTPPELDE
jgi:hypothetical protein